MNQYDYERSKKIEAIQSLLANVSMNTLNSIIIEVRNMPESGLRDLLIEAQDEVNEARYNAGER